MDQMIRCVKGLFLTHLELSRRQYFTFQASGYKQDETEKGSAMGQTVEKIFEGTVHRSSQAKLEFRSQVRRRVQGFVKVGFCSLGLSKMQALSNLLDRKGRLLP